MWKHKNFINLQLYATFKHFYDAGTIGTGAVKFRHYSQTEPLPQLATPQNVAANGTTVSWDEVENATSYAVLADGNEIGTVDYIATKTLEESTWAEIAQVSANKSWDAMGWKVGDTKTITLNGTVGTVALNNYQCKVYILGFDHNADKEGQGISFGMLEGIDGKQLCLVDGSYNATTSSATAFIMNTSNTNSGGWKNCHMRKTILGSTDVTNGDATSAAITNPASGTLMAALPSDLRAVLKPITKYTNNVGKSSAASAITPTVDYLPLLSEYEVFKTHSYANRNEDAYQAQYQYYANGKSKVKYQHNSVSNTAYWRLRSPAAGDSASFCLVLDSGAIYVYNVSLSCGVVPVFLV